MTVEFPRLVEEVQVPVSPWTPRPITIKRGRDKCVCPLGWHDEARQAADYIAQAFRLAPMPSCIQSIEVFAEDLNTVLRIRMLVVDRRDEQSELDLTFASAAAAGLPITSRDEYLREFVYRTIRECLVHELDECFFVHDVRVRDPHKNEKTQ